MNYKEVLAKFFATPELVGQYVREPFSKVEDKLCDKWSDLLKIAFDGRSKMNILQDKSKV